MPGGYSKWDSNRLLAQSPPWSLSKFSPQKLGWPSTVTLYLTYFQKPKPCENAKTQPEKHFYGYFVVMKRCHCKRDDIGFQTCGGGRHNPHVLAHRNLACLAAVLTFASSQSPVDITVEQKSDLSLSLQGTK